MITEKRVIDLGLPSGTKWADANEECYYNFVEAVEKYGDSLPTKEQWEELKDLCQWAWMGDGYRVTGSNGNSIFLPAAGYRSCNGDVLLVGYDGHYWSSTPIGSFSAWDLFFYSCGVHVFDSYHCNDFSVRLVQNLKGDKK